MNILIVGNGFDLSHYLPTKYDHFMVAMDAIENWDETKGDMGFDDLFGSLYEKEDYFFSYTKSMYKTDEIKISFSEIKKLKKQLKENVWYRYFKFYRSKTDTWIDLEQKIEEALECCAIFFKKIDVKIEENSKISYLFKRLDERGESNSIKLHNREIHILFLLGILCGKNLVSSTPIHIWENVDKNDSEYYKNERYRNIINNDFIDENGSYMLYKVDSAVNFLNNKMKDFILLFNLYLVEFISKLEKKNSFKNILDFRPDIIYSFNYTDTYRNFYYEADVDFLHGRCGYSQNIVLGVSDLKDERLKKIKAFGFTKYHQKLMNMTDYQFFRENKKIERALIENRVGSPIRKVNQQKNIRVVIWGHSLNISDESYIEEIFSFNKVNDEFVRVTVLYFNDRAKFDLLANLLEILGKEKVENWMKKGWLKFEENPDIAKLNGIEPVELPKISAS
ncbi:hypothetical protein D9K80_06715 [Acinetobacter cumulans]|uniref:Bacteriophage abortive infection AbiH n=1 Tax=Acinetobacter cumulans TaxID=2136182 RepID=A0A498D1W3_9GAMM|nr:AbiH family protein [Acinetobacter cumulans]RLL36013.1 hypothetical protein D9K80_06715 [Acinetobacter cumulans]